MEKESISKDMKTVAIVCGGDTSEHDVSMRSAAGIESFLDKERYIIYKVYGKEETLALHPWRTPHRDRQTGDVLGK